MLKLNRKQLLGVRIRELRRKVLHEHNDITRRIYKTHVINLENELRSLEERRW